MSLKSKWMKKKTLEEDTFEIDGQEITVRQLSGTEALHAQEIEDTVERSFFVYNACMITEDMHMTREEFRHAFEKCYSEVDGIIGRIMKVGKEKN